MSPSPPPADDPAPPRAARGPAHGFPPLHDLSRVPRGTVLVVAPHPDDEILGCGGAIALHVQRGDAVHVTLVTRGEGSGDGSARLAESRAAAAALGPTQVTCLGAADGAVAADAELPARLGELLQRVRPAVVYAPSPFEMHPDHVAVLEATAAALLACSPLRLPCLLLYEVNTEGMASFLLDITPVAAAKSAALAAFASQLGSIDLLSKAEARNRARTMNVDIAAVQHAEAFLELRPEAVAPARAALAALAAELGLAGPAAAGAAGLARSQGTAPAGEVPGGALPPGSARRA